MLPQSHTPDTDSAKANTSARPRRRQARSSILTLIVALVVLAAAAHAQSSKWSLVLVESPIHIGDDSLKAFARPDPQAKSCHRKFSLPDQVKHGLADTFIISLDISDLTSRKDKKSAKMMQRGLYITTLAVNGQEVAVLNKLIKGRELAQKQEHLTLEIRGTMLSKGENVIEIIPGVGNDGNSKNLEDFEIFRLAIQQK